MDVASLLAAYRQGTFPWFSDGQPILWWSTDPRMVLAPTQFRLHRSLRKRIEQRCVKQPTWHIRIDSDFAQTIYHCANTPRQGQNGTWIVQAMQEAYTDLHQAGYAHSVEVWEDSRMVGGLYCVAIGKAVYGESMFAHTDDASKVALAALVGLCLHHGVDWIDCQQNTRHLASLGGAEMDRAEFLAHIATACLQAPLVWQFDPVYWNALYQLTRQ
nr:leucyl/phenylalanyl-tRNA--protein transferase [Curvibacter sp. CHRR-16]